MALLQVLETHIFHSFLKDRLNKKMDNFARMELATRSEMQKWVIEYIFKNFKPKDNIQKVSHLICVFLLSIWEDQENFFV